MLLYTEVDATSASNGARQDAPGPVLTYDDHKSKLHEGFFNQVEGLILSHLASEQFR